MTPAEFIAKWQANTRTERAACQEHFLDLCHLLDEPTPNSDPTVAAAYGWPADLSDDEILARLLALNHERAAQQ